MPAKEEAPRTLKIDGEPPEFPAITFPKRGLPESVPGVEALQCRARVTVDAEYYSGAILIDLHGKRFRVERVEGVRYAPPFWGFRILHKRLMLVRWWLKEEGMIGLEEFRALCIARGFRCPEARTESTDLEEDFLSQQDSIRKLIDAFREIY